MDNLFETLTVKELVPIFSLKDNTEAERIELLTFEENDYKIVVQKGLWQSGDFVQYIYPDSNLKEGNDYLDDFIKPMSPEGKELPSKLGSNNRVKAIKFNFHTGNSEKLFSNGIIVPIDINLEEFVYKHEDEPNTKSAHGIKIGKYTNLPEGFYKTDESRWEKQERNLTYPVDLIGTLKADGSSITLWAKINSESGICSRNLSKPLTIKINDGFKYKYLPKLSFYLSKWFKIPKWNIEQLYKEVDNTDDFVTLGKPYLQNLIQLAKQIKETQFSNDNSFQGVVIRGEAVGKTMKGSGNKNNPHSKQENHIEAYGVDFIFNGESVRVCPFTFLEICESLQIPTVNVITYSQSLKIDDKFLYEVPVIKFNSKEEIEQFCNSYFKENLVEGIVLRSYYDTSFSCKYMNPEYDAKK